MRLLQHSRARPCLHGVTQGRLPLSPCQRVHTYHRPSCSKGQWPKHPQRSAASGAAAALSPRGAADAAPAAERAHALPPPEVLEAIWRGLEVGARVLRASPVHASSAIAAEH